MRAKFQVFVAVIFCPRQNNPVLCLPTLSVASFIHSSKLVVMTSMLTCGVGVTAERRLARRSRCAVNADTLRIAGDADLFSLSLSTRPMSAKCALLRRAARSAASSLMSWFARVLLRSGVFATRSDSGLAIIAFLPGPRRTSGVDGDADMWYV